MTMTFEALALQIARRPLVCAHVSSRVFTQILLQILACTSGQEFKNYKYGTKVTS